MAEHIYEGYDLSAPMEVRIKPTDRGRSSFTLLGTSLLVRERFRHKVDSKVSAEGQGILST